MSAGQTRLAAGAPASKGPATTPRRILTLAMAGVVATAGLTACDDDPKRVEIGVILPDSKSSPRWETADRKYLEAAFKAAGVDYDIQNAQNDKQQFQTIADQMITSGVNVLMIANLDSGTGKAVLAKARAQGIETIDYDRLTLDGGASYYVSFDNVKVGTMQGEGLVKCLTDKHIQRPVVAELSGSQTDNNATLLKQGYDAVLKPRYDSGQYVKGPAQRVPEWDGSQAGTIFEQMLTSNTDIAGVLAANDGLGHAAITVLKKNGLNGKVPVTGQDATVQGLQNILLGDQCMTVYKAVKQEADAAASLAVALAKGNRRKVTGTVRDPKGNRDVPAVLLTPKAIYANNVKEVVDDGYVTAAQLCTGEVAPKCLAAGIK